MANPSIMVSPAETRSKNADSFDLLVPLGWWGGLAAILVLLIASFFLAGYFLIYWRNADMDFMVIYSALSQNDGHYFFFEHPAYLTILAMSRWLQLLHGLGFIDVSSLSMLPGPRDAAAFDHAMTEIVRAGRILSGLMAIAFIMVFAGLSRCLVRDWRIAMFATFAFAFSGGMAVHLRILRSELISGCLFAFAVMILIIVARRGMIWRPLVVGLAAGLCVLALENKVHAVLLIAVLPGLMLPFGASAGASAAFWRSRSAWALVAGAMVLTAFLMWHVVPLLATGLYPDQTAALSLHPLLRGQFGIYQAALTAWIVVSVLVFAWLWKASLSETLATLFAITAGAALALSALYISYDRSNVVVVLNPVEQMLSFADSAAVAAAGKGDVFAGAGLVLSGVVGVLKRYTFVLFTSTRPTVFLTWLICPGIVYAWRRGDRQVAIQATFLMLAAIGIDALGVRRGLKSEYFILTDPLIILAGLLLLDRMPELGFNKWTYPLGVVLVVVHVAVGQAEPVRLAMKQAGPELICQWRRHHFPRLIPPWCGEFETRPAS